MEANKALKLSKGREEKDGKFKFAQGVSALGAVVTGYSSLVLGEKLGTQYIRHFDPKTGVANFAGETGAKFMKQNKILAGLMAATAVLATAAFAIGGLNKHSAEKTANERGFYTDKDFLTLGGSGKERAEKAYDLIENTYAKHVKTEE